MYKRKQVWLFGWTVPLIPTVATVWTDILPVRVLSLCYQLHQGIFHQSYSHKLPQCFISVSHPLPDLSQLYSSGSYSSESLEEMAVGCSTLVKTPFLSSVWSFSQTIWPDKKQLFKAQDNFTATQFLCVCVLYLCVYRWCQVDWLTRNTLDWLVHQSKTMNRNLHQQ